VSMAGRGFNSYQLRICEPRRRKYRYASARRTTPGVLATARRFDCHPTGATTVSVSQENVRLRASPLRCSTMRLQPSGRPDSSREDRSRQVRWQRFRQPIVSRIGDSLLEPCGSASPSVVTATSPEPSISNDVSNFKMWVEGRRGYRIDRTFIVISYQLLTMLQPRTRLR